MVGKPARIVLKPLDDEESIEWYAVRVDLQGLELERSPPGTFEQASAYRDNYHRYGAWNKS